MLNQEESLDWKLGVSPAFVVNTLLPLLTADLRGNLFRSLNHPELYHDLNELFLALNASGRLELWRSIFSPQHANQLSQERLLGILPLSVFDQAFIKGLAPDEQVAFALTAQKIYPNFFHKNVLPLITNGHNM